MTVFRLFRTNLTRQLRSTGFIMTVAAGILLGVLCVPAAGAGYQIFDFGGVRGINNSAWLGAFGAMLPTILLWLPGFYLLRNQISQDRRLKIGQSIAATPISNLRYIGGKACANFLLLALLQAVFVLVLVGMQLVRGESLALHITDFLMPFAAIALPYLAVAAAFTVLFDVIPFLRGAVGNILMFFIWTGFTSVSVIVPGGWGDLFGLGMVLNAITEGARLIYPAMPGGQSFGYYKVAATAPTFVWQGMTWPAKFLLSRLWWLGLAGAMVVVSALVFDRFKAGSRPAKAQRPARANKKATAKKSTGIGPVVSLSPVKMGGGAVGMLAGQIKIMLAGRSIWWYLAVLCANVAALVAAPATELRWLACGLLLLVPVCSGMGCAEAMHNTAGLVHASRSPRINWLVSWAGGVLVSLLLSAGLLWRVAMQTALVLPLIAGLIIACTLAQSLGALSGDGRFFEAVYIVLFYLGVVQGMPAFDFMGLHASGAFWGYGAAAAALAGASLFAAGHTGKHKKG